MTHLGLLSGWIGLLLLGALPFSGSWATTFYERPFPEVVGEAEVVVRGVVAGNHVEWGGAEDGSKRIYTYYDLQVGEVLRGGVDARSLQVRQIGGEKDGVGLHIAGSARFERGEDVVVFLGPKNEDGSYSLKGLVMGKLNVEKDSQGVERLAGAALTGGDDGHGHPERHDDSDGAKGWTLDSLRTLIKEQDSKNPTNKQELKNQSLRNSPSPVSSEAAPQLQPPSSGDVEGPPSDEAPEGLKLPMLLAGAVILLGLFGWIFFRRR